MSVALHYTPGKCQKERLCITDTLEKKKAKSKNQRKEIEKTERKKQKESDEGKGNIKQTQNKETATSEMATDSKHPDIERRNCEEN